MTITRAITCLGIALAAAACGRAALNVGELDEMDRVRASPGAREGAQLAPEAYARAELERDAARQAHASGDDVAAVLHAQRAVAAYGHALAIARLARATADLADAQKALDDATVQEQALEASRAKLDRDTEELEQRVRLARERSLPAASEAATPEREAARAVAARSLGVQARLLCGAARLIAPDAAGLPDAVADVSALDQRLTKNVRPAPIDDATRVRARCLDILTRSRRGAGNDAGANDALLAELSAAGGWDPARDERGVAVTLRDAFQGSELSGGAEAKLKDLGRVGASHPGFGIQVVVHDAQAPLGDAVDAKRADAAVRALVAGGAAAARIDAELAGARVPVADPSDARTRARNERLEIVFVR
ncbi:MAG TPA: hypothetical protein VE987_16990 [Polyangiaceae bacterium]|nr:hypothetical protein [Polyangiaceae bacterium]